LTELVTDLGLVVPSVLTVMAPDVKKMPGPYRASPVGTVAVIGVAEPVAGSVTVGAGPRSTAGLFKREILVK